MVPLYCCYILHHGIGYVCLSVQVTDFVIILNTKNAVDAFSKGGNLTLGGNFTVAVGPMGRNAEADVSVRSPAAIYTYSKTKGLFAGISIEGSALIERKDANKKLVLRPSYFKFRLSQIIERCIVGYILWHARPTLS